ncbi:MAG: HEAT repeat domain-containing protein [bacterium]|nr:HEAT repeat domain-containing protein [bacterium]
MKTAMDVEHILAILEDGSNEKKSAVLEKIRDSDNISLIAPIAALIEKEKSRAIKERMMLLLNRLVPLSEYKNIDPMLRSTDPFVRNGIVGIIKRSQFPIVNFMENLADDDNKDVRKFVIDSLSQEKSEKTMAIVRKKLHDPDINIIYTAIEILGNFKDEEAVEEIESLLINSRHFMITCSALETLAKIKKSPNKHVIFKKFMNAGTNPILTFPLLRYLAAFGSFDSFAYIEAIFDTGAETFTKEVIDAIYGITKNNRLSELPGSLRSKLEYLQENTNSTNKYAIIKLLTRADGCADIKQLDKIRTMLDNKSVMIQLCAVELLADFGLEEDIASLKALAAQPGRDDLLEAIGDALIKIEIRLGLVKPESGDSWPSLQ